jgi:hypothetical protein
MPSDSQTQPCWERLKDALIYDSGAGASAFNDLKWFIEIDTERDAMCYRNANGSINDVPVKGVVAYTTNLSTGQQVTVKLPESRYNPTGYANFICAGRMLDDGIFWDQKSHRLYKEDTGEVVTELERVDNHFVVPNAVPASQQAEAKTADGKR